MRCLPGILLVVFSVIALIVANSPFGYIHNYFFNEIKIFNDFTVHMIINDFLMAIFFLGASLEIKKEVLYGNLSSFKKASFPIIAAIGGVLVPAIIFILFNNNTTYIEGVGIPIATDIAFAIGIFMMLENRLNYRLKIFLLSLAVVDDLISIIVIGALYPSNIDIKYVLVAALTTVIIYIINKGFKVKNTYLYMILGLFLWYFVQKSGVHSTISGVLLGLVMPLNRNLEHNISNLSSFFILPLFALSNTAIKLNTNINFAEGSTLIQGIIFGLVIGKPLGIMLFTYIATKLHITQKPKNTSWLSIFNVAVLASIGFTMSIFVSEIAFSNSSEITDMAKISILISLVISIGLSYIITIVVDSLKRALRLSYITRRW
jgi:Na+:H+ antiporter, NhaA family